MRNFTLDESYITEVSVYREWSIYAGKESLTDEELIRVLKGEGICSSHSYEDHPEFTKLRKRLGEGGLIEIETQWYNGDRVLKPFTLNGVKFKKNEKFYCAGAMQGYLKYKRSKGRSA